MNIKCRSKLKSSSAFYFCFWFFFSILNTQYSILSFSQVEDSIRISFHKKPKPIVGFSSKNTFINGFNSPIYTASAGLDFNHTVKIGAGVSWLQLSAFENGKDNSPFYLDKTFSDASGFHSVHSSLQFRYIDFFFEYVYFHTKKWQFSLPLQIGIGGSSYQYDYNGEKIIEDEHTILLYEPTVSGQYKILRWFGVGLDVGYRIMLISNRNIGAKFNSPIYSAGAIIYWGELYKIIFEKK